MALLEMFLTLIGFPAIAAAVCKGGAGMRVGWFAGTLFVCLVVVSVGSLLTMAPVGIVMCIVAGCTGGPRTRLCPDCAEKIQFDARKCRYCGAAVEQKKPEPAQ